MPAPNTCSVQSAYMLGIACAEHQCVTIGIGDVKKPHPWPILDLLGIKSLRSHCLEVLIYVLNDEVMPCVGNPLFLLRLRKRQADTYRPCGDLCPGWWPV